YPLVSDPLVTLKIWFLPFVRTAHNMVQAQSLPWPYDKIVLSTNPKTVCQSNCHKTVQADTQPNTPQLRVDNYKNVQDHLHAYDPKRPMYCNLYCRYRFL